MSEKTETSNPFYTLLDWTSAYRGGNKKKTSIRVDDKLLDQDWFFLLPEKFKEQNLKYFKDYKIKQPTSLKTFRENYFSAQDASFVVLFHVLKRDNFFDPYSPSSSYKNICPVKGYITKQEIIKLVDLFAYRFTKRFPGEYNTYINISNQISFFVEKLMFLKKNYSILQQNIEELIYSIVSWAVGYSGNTDLDNLFLKGLYCLPTTKDITNNAGSLLRDVYKEKLEKTDFLYKNTRAIYGFYRALKDISYAYSLKSQLPFFLFFNNFYESFVPIFKRLHAAVDGAHKLIKKRDEKGIVENTILSWPPILEEDDNYLFFKETTAYCCDIITKPLFETKLDDFYIKLVKDNEVLNGG